MLKSSAILATFSELLIFAFLIGVEDYYLCGHNLYFSYYCYIDIFKFIGIFSLLNDCSSFDSFLFVESLYIF